MGNATQDKIDAEFAIECLQMEIENTIIPKYIDGCAMELHKNVDNVNQARVDAESTDAKTQDDLEELTESKIFPPSSDAGIGYQIVNTTEISLQTLK